jgi:hypothetical protein
MRILTDDLSLIATKLPVEGTFETDSAPLLLLIKFERTLEV